ncbi:hypothetical protein ACFO5K_04560 [Nocardia halotolerans]|uniref:Uncharacterized protein n=1 Tax=Nocardia halotolerans TaxID=1755878 RepID=A0ABV8VBR2_9NOCA
MSDGLTICEQNVESLPVPFIERSQPRARGTGSWFAGSLPQFESVISE